mgnify:CR=1 FL=1
MKTAPILMIGFNRPDFTRGLLDCVRRVRPTKLYFAVDGPRADRPDDDRTVSAVRAVVGNVDWPCDVKTLFRESNLGCARGVAEAISWFFDAEPYGIILEDDIRPTEGFFAYASELLERYREDPRVGMVAGFDAYGNQTPKNESYHFSNRPDIWGWGTWRRVWQDYSLDISAYLPRLDEIVSRHTANLRERRLMKEGFAQVLCNPKTWDYQFQLMFVSKGYLSAVPRKRLVTNVGLGDVRAVHTTGMCYDMSCWGRAWGGAPSLVHPVRVALDQRAVRRDEQRRNGLAAHGIDWLSVKIPCGRRVFQCLGRIAETVAPALFRI